MESAESTVRAYFEALNRSDVDGAVALFAEDGALLVDEVPTATGREQIRGVFVGAFLDRSFQREVRVDRIREESGVAVARTHTTGTIKILAPGTTLPVASRELFVLRKATAGWLITEYMFNRPG